MKKKSTVSNPNDKQLTPSSEKDYTSLISMFVFGVYLLITAGIVWIIVFA